MTDFAHLLTIAQAAAQRGADLVRTSQFSELTAKGDRDYASDVDYKIERVLRDFLHTASPGIGFLGEEEGMHAVSDIDLYWALDPIDGTVNFANGLPLCAVSLALVQGQTPVAGVIELPLLNRTYAAAQGMGATCNGGPITVAQPARLGDAIVSIGDYAVGPNAQDQNDDRLALTSALAGSALRIRMFGSAAIDLAWLAEGSTGATIMLSNRPWDTAAGVVIAREAGARVLDLDGSEHSTESGATIAAAPSIAVELLSVLHAAVSLSERNPQA